MSSEPIPQQMKEGQMPKRIQRRRTPGWRQPANAIYVGRPTKWGNLYYIGTGMYCQVNVLPTNDREFDKKEAVRLMEEFQARHPSVYGGLTQTLREDAPQT
jgi:hypothetical protein